MLIYQAITQLQRFSWKAYFSSLFRNSPQTSNSEGKIHLDKRDLNKILRMYRGVYRNYLQEVDIDFNKEELKARVKPPLITPYLEAWLPLNHVNNLEVMLVLNQSLFLLYRQALIEGKLGAPQVGFREIELRCDRMFVKKEFHYYVEAHSRVRETLDLKLEHKKTKKIGDHYWTWCDANVPGFFKAEMTAAMSEKIQ